MRCNRFGFAIFDQTGSENESKKCTEYALAFIEKHKFVFLSGETIKWNKTKCYDQVWYVPPDQSAKFRQHMKEVLILLRKAIGARNATVGQAEKWNACVYFYELAENEDE